MEHIARAPRFCPSEVDGQTLRPGELLMHGQYRIERFIGAGGFGITYRARDCLDRGVVIKECFPNAICTREDSVVRTRSNRLQPEFEALVREFGLEARRMARLSHPNIVGVHQVFEDNGTAYMALDLVPGRDLLDLLEHDRDRLSPEHIKEMLLKLLSAVAYLHEREILHRDISPDNILVDQNGNPVLIDFGAAHETAARSSALKSALQMVKDGYSPQEFYLGTDNHGAFSDLYSLAATFYHVITGTAPPDSQQRLAAVAHNKPDPLRPIPMATSGFDQYFVEAIHRGLEIFPDDRLATAQDWLRLVDEAQRQAALAAHALQDTEIDRAIKHLTAETNRIIRETIAAERAAEAKRKAEAAAREEEERARKAEAQFKIDENDILRQPLEEFDLAEDDALDGEADGAEAPPRNGAHARPVTPRPQPGSAFRRPTVQGASARPANGDPASSTPRGSSRTRPVSRRVPDTQAKVPDATTAAPKEQRSTTFKPKQSARQTNAGDRTANLKAKPRQAPHETPHGTTSTTAKGKPETRPDSAQAPADKPQSQQDILPPPTPPKAPVRPMRIVTKKANQE